MRLATQSRSLHESKSEGARAMRRCACQSGHRPTPLMLGVEGMYVPGTTACEEEVAVFPQAGSATARRFGLVAVTLLILTAVALLAPQFARADSLPPNLLIAPGTQISGFETSTEWGVQTTLSTGAWALNTTQFREGTHSLQLTVTAPATSSASEVVQTATYATPLDLSGAGSIRLWVDLQTDPSSVGSLYLHFSSDAGFTSKYSYNCSAALHSGWNLLNLAKSDFSVGSGSPSWASIVRVRIALTARAGRTATASFDDLRYGVVSQPVVLLSFKNGTLGQYANAAPVLASHGYVGTAFVDSSDVGKSGQMTLAQLKELYASGWDVGNHSNSSAQLTTLGLDGARTALSACSNYLIQNGMPRAARQVAYVDGQYNDTVLQAMHDTGMLSGTTISALSQHGLQALPMDNPYIIPSWDAGLLISGGGVAAVEARIDEAVARGAPIELIFHDVSAPGTASSGYTVSADDLKTICDYIAAKPNLPVLTISQLLALNSDSIGPLQNDHWPPITTATTIAAEGGGRTVTLTASDSLSGVQATYYTLDGIPATYDGPFTVSDGPHSLSYYSVDRAGNVETPTTMSDFSPPQTTCSAQDGAWASGLGSLTLSASDDSAVREIDYSLDGGASWTSVPGAKASVTITAEGPVALTYHAVDTAGNVEADHLVHLTIDNTPPVSTLSGVDDLPHPSDVTLTLSATDGSGNSGVASLSYRIDQGETVVTPGGGPLDITIGQGNHRIAYWSTDNAGNVETARTVYERVGAATLPPNLITNPGTQISSFDDSSMWTLMNVNGSGGTVAADTANVKEGSASLRLTTGDPATSAGTVIAQMSLGSGVDMSSMLAGGTIRFWVYVYSQPQSVVGGPVNILKTFRLRLSPDADGSFTNQFVWATNRTAIHTGWNQICLSAADFGYNAVLNQGQNPIGNPSWNQPMRYVRLEVTANSAQTQPASVSFDDLRYGVYATPAVIMSFDDGDATVYSTALPIMQQAGLKGTAYIISSQIGSSDHPETMSLANLHALYDAGWDLGNHTVTHDNFATFTEQQMETEFSGCANFLIENGMGRAAKHVAYPGGLYNGDVQAAMTATGMLTGRGTSFRPTGLPLDDPYQIPGSTVAVNTLSLSQIEARIDQAVNDGAMIELYFHAFGDPAAHPDDPNYWTSPAELNAICDYIAQQGIPVLTISQYYNLSTGSDTEPPTIAISDGPGAWITTSSQAVSWSGTDNLTPVDQLVYQYQLDGGEWSSWSGATTATLSGLAEGQHVFSVRAKDLSGNVSEPASCTFSVDTVLPTASATASPDKWTTGNVSVFFTASDAGSGLDVASATCSVDGSAVPYTYGSPVPVTTEGNHSVVFTIKDMAGNIATAQATAQIDRTAPSAVATAVPSTWTNGSVSVSVTATDALSGVNQQSVTYSVDGAARQPLVWGTPVVIDTAGTHTVSFRVADMVGNTTSVSATARIDRTAPTTTVNYSSAAWQRSNVTLRFSASDTGGSGVAYTESSIDNGTTWVTGTSRTISAQGSTRVLYRSADKAGNVEVAKSVTVNIDKTAPTVVIQAPLSGGTYLRNQVVLASWSATDSISGLNLALTSSTPVDNGVAIPTSTFGSKSFSVTATDNAGNVTKKTISYSVPFASAGVLAPINTDGSSSFALGTVIPVSFVLTNSSGGAYGTAHPALYVARQQTDGSWGTEQSAVASPPVSGGNLFTYAGAGKYTFNWGTAGLTAGVWLLHIDLGKGGALYAQLSLR
jgi:peptidoglycan/xylan/chitin deacetylase (PgdA/CDA1 family)